jgi:hypothetical protein
MTTIHTPQSFNQFLSAGIEALFTVTNTPTSLSSVKVQQPVDFSFEFSKFGFAVSREVVNWHEAEEKQGIEWTKRSPNATRSESKWENSQIFLHGMNTMNKQTRK